jgi:hypothetical protein
VQGVSDDTLVTYQTLNGPFRGYYGSVTIRADGTVVGVIRDAVDGNPVAQGVGRISQEELRAVLLEFARIDLFALQTVSEHGYDCAYHSLDVSDPASHPYPETDAPTVAISITVRGVSKSIVTYLGCGQAHLGGLEDMIVGIGRRALAPSTYPPPAPTGTP